MGRNSTIICEGIVFRNKSTNLHGDIRYEGIWQDQAIIQHRGIKKRFQDTSGTPGGSDDIHLIPMFIFTFMWDISHIGQYVSRIDIKDKRCCIFNFICFKLRVMQ